MPLNAFSKISTPSYLAAAIASSFYLRFPEIETVATEVCIKVSLVSKYSNLICFRRWVFVKCRNTFGVIMVFLVITGKNR